MDVVLPPYFVSEALSWLTLGGSGWLAWRLVRAVERLGTGRQQLRVLAARVRQLEAAVDRVEGGLREGGDAQRFTTRLLLRQAGGERCPHA